MLKRPKPGEDEDDLLEFQRQFLAAKTAPSVTLEQRSEAPKKDVVHLEGLPAMAPAGGDTKPSPMKKSRFAARTAEAKHQQTNVTHDNDGDIIDEHERSTATVLAKIIEKDTRYGNFSLPVQVKLPFPAVSTLQTSKAQENPQGAGKQKKKKSLFAQQMMKDMPVSSDQMESGQHQQAGASASSNAPKVIDGSGLSVTFSDREATDIHHENITKLSAMSTDEIIQERAKLLQSLDPKLVEFLKKKKAATSKSLPEPTNHQEQMETHEAKSKNVTVKQDTPDEPAVPISVDSRWVNMGTVEGDKLAWMKDLPPPSADHAQSGTAARFDFQGQIMSPDADVPVNLGLHHHGDEAERAGYTLEELFTLSRSSNNQQRVLALQTLARVVTQAKQGGLAELVQTPVLPSILDAGVVFLLRWALDDSVPAVMVAAVSALNALLVNQADELCLDKVFNWYQGYRVSSQAPVIQESVGIKLPGEAEEKPQQTDADVVHDDVIQALVSRMNLLSRVYYVLTTVRPQAPTVIAILEILVRVGRHSVNMANQVFSHKGLLEVIIKEFLPITWTDTQSQEGVGVSNVYGVPLVEAMRLILTLCQAGRNMTAILLSRFGIQERLERYLLTDISGRQCESSAAMRLAALKVWKICLSYGLANSIFLDGYAHLMDELRITSLPEHLSTLIGCMEMAVISAAHQHNKHKFKHMMEGGGMEVEGHTEESDSTGPCINWSHVAGLIQPITLHLRNLLTDVANNYQIKKEHLQLTQACLNFVSTFYICSQTQIEKGYVMTCLSEMEEIYTFISGVWNSIGITYIRSQLSSHSNILQYTEANSEVSKCLSEYGNSSIKEENFQPVVRTGSPYGFLTALYRLVYSFAKVHKGLITNKDQLAGILSIVNCPDVWSYLRKVVITSPAVHTYFSKFEIHFQYYLLKLATLVVTADVSSKLDLALLHHVCLHMLTSVSHGDEYIVHDLLSTVVFNQHLCSKSGAEVPSIPLEDMQLSEQPTTQLRTKSSPAVQATSQQLCGEACSCLPSICGSYMAAFSHMQDQVLSSRRHFVQGNPDSQSCYTCNHGDCLMPQDWMYLPLIELYNIYSTVGLEVQNVLSSNQLDTVRNVLRWLYLVEYNRTSRLQNVDITLKISRIMCVFLTGNDMFLDRSVHCYLEGLLKLYCKPSLLGKMNFDQDIPGLPSFYDLFVALLEQYEAVSFGDSLFACYVMIPLQQRHSIQYRKAIFTEYTGLMRILSLPLNELLIDIQAYLTPEETSVELLRLYYQSLYSGKLRPSWSPVLYLVTVHHVNRFIYTRGSVHKQLKISMMANLLSSTNQELCKHVVYYKMADLSQKHGMELYTELPASRQRYVDSVKPS